MDDYYWWYAYGRFAPGEENLPHVGNVIRYYLSLSGWSTKQAAKRLECTERYLKMLSSEGNKDMPQLLS